MPRFYAPEPALRRFWWVALGLLISPLLSATLPAPTHPSAHPAPAADSVACHLRGRVLDAYTQEPLPFASLWLKRLDQGTQSDEQGYFEFELTDSQLDSVLTDTLQAQAPAFRQQAQLISFQAFPADSVLQLTLLRDPTVATSAPLLTRAPRRSRSQSAVATPGPASTSAATAPRRSFWQRLFGRRP